MPGPWLLGTLYLLHHSSSLSTTTTTTTSFNLGLIYDSNSSSKEHLLKVAQFTLSRLEQQYNTTISLTTKTYAESHLSSVTALCQFVESNTAVVISDSGSSKTKVEADILGEFHVPVISTSATNPFLKSEGDDRDYLLLMSPSDKYQSAAVFQVLDYYNWKEFSILASANDYGIMGVVHLKYITTSNNQFTLKDTLYFKVGMDFSVRKELIALKNSLTRVIVLNCDVRYARQIFKEAHELGLMEPGFVWLVTDSISTQPRELADDNGQFPDYYDGIIGTAPDYVNKLANYARFAEDYISAGGQAQDLTVSSVLLADAISLAHAALTSIASNGGDMSRDISCSSRDYWSKGDVMLRALLNASIDGATGKVDFDKSGSTTTIGYKIVNFREDSLVNIGSWKEEESLEMSTDVRFLGGLDEPPKSLTTTLAGFHFVLGIVVEEPLVYKLEGCTDTRDPACWSGLMPELTWKLATDLNFTFEYLEPQDEKFGGYHQDSDSWTGMIGDLVAGKTNYTGQALAISTERSEYMDFSTSFYEGGASIVVAGHENMAANKFFFLKPFKSSVWLFMGGVVVGLTLIIWFYTKTSPYSRYADGNENISIYWYKSAWVAAAGLVRMSTETFPANPSGRFLLFAWWFLAMVLSSMYTANLAAFMTLEHAALPLKAMKDLLAQKKYSWGVISDRNIESRLLNHVDSQYHKLVQEGVQLENLTEAKAKVLEGGFAFIDETSVLSYQFREDCSTVQIDEGVLNSEWAFAFPRNSPFKSLIDGMILQYRENGYLSKVWKKWYNKAASCARATKSSRDDLRFGMDMLSGLFLMFGIAVAAACVLFVVEILYYAIIKCFQTSW